MNPTLFMKEIWSREPHLYNSSTGILWVKGTLHITTPRLSIIRILICRRLLAGCLLRALRRLIGIHFIFYYGTSFFAAFGIKQSFVAGMITSSVNVFSTLADLYPVEASGGFCWRYAVFVWFLNLRDEGAWFGGRG